MSGTVALGRRDLPSKNDQRCALCRQGAIPKQSPSCRGGSASAERTHLGPHHLSAYERCHHPAMKSDYFRLCFIARHGGFYVDADEVFQGVDCESLFADPRLKLQPHWVAAVWVSPPAG